MKVPGEMCVSQRVSHWSLTDKTIQFQELKDRFIDEGEITGDTRQTQIHHKYRSSPDCTSSVIEIKICSPCCGEYIGRLTHRQAGRLTDRQEDRKSDWKANRQRREQACT